MTAGVHGAVDLGGVHEPGVLGHGQRVHVAAEQHGAARATGVERGDHRAQGIARADVESEVGDGLEHPGLGAGQVEPELGVLVQLTAQRDGLGQQTAGLLQQLVHVVPALLIS